jgi:hypothetical protein
MLEFDVEGGIAWKRTVLVISSAESSVILTT